MEAVNTRVSNPSGVVSFCIPVPTSIDDPAASWLSWFTTSWGDPIRFDHPLADLCSGYSDAPFGEVLYTGTQGWWVQAKRVFDPSVGIDVVELTGWKVGQAGADDGVSYGRDVVGRLLGSEELERADVLFRATVENLHQAIYLYQPIWEEARIVDLEIVYCNQAALALPFTEPIVKGALASNVFKDPEIAMREAEQVWRDGSATPYSIERSGLIDGAERTIRYEIHTVRVGDHILQTSTDHTIADELTRSEARQRLILEALTEGVTLLTPLFDDGQIIGTRELYSNAAAKQFRARGIFDGANRHELTKQLATRTWESRLPAMTFVDSTEYGKSGGAETHTEVEAVRVGDAVVQVVRDRSRELRIERAMASTQARFARTVGMLAHGIGVWVPIRHEKGQVEDFILDYANTSLASILKPGVRASMVAFDADLLQAARLALVRNGQPVAVVATQLDADPGLNDQGSLVHRFTLTSYDDEVVMVAEDVSDVDQTLSSLRSSEAALAAVIAAVSERVRV